MTWHRPNDPAGRITSPFGQRVAPYDGASTYHLGVDLRAGVYGVPGDIYAAAPGRVYWRYVTPMGANVVVIDHGAGIKTYYVHMPDGGIFVKVGDLVKGGQRIAVAGMTGAATIHLHFETRVNGVAVDPVPFMRARGIDLTQIIVPTKEDDIVATLDDLRKVIREEAGNAVWGHTLTHRDVSEPAVVVLVDAGTNAAIGARKTIDVPALAAAIADELPDASTADVEAALRRVLDGATLTLPGATS